MLLPISPTPWSSWLCYQPSLDICSHIILFNICCSKPLSRRYTSYLFSMSSFCDCLLSKNSAWWSLNNKHRQILSINSEPSPKSRQKFLMHSCYFYNWDILSCRENFIPPDTNDSFCYCYKSCCCPNPCFLKRSCLKPDFYSGFSCSLDLCKPVVLVMMPSYCSASFKRSLSLLFILSSLLNFLISTSLKPMACLSSSNFWCSISLSNLSSSLICCCFYLSFWENRSLSSNSFLRFRYWPTACLPDLSISLNYWT